MEALQNDQHNHEINPLDGNSSTSLENGNHFSIKLFVFTGERLNQNELKVYDRQLRVWGFEAQKK